MKRLRRLAPYRIHPRSPQAMGACARAVIRGCVSIPHRPEGFVSSPLARFGRS
jgi:hypothetical protein